MGQPVFIVAGIGKGGGTGAATARLFAKQGYRIALVSRTKENLDALAEEIRAAGGDAASFPVVSYGYGDVLGIFDTIRAHNWGDGERAEIRGALYNVGSAPFKNFLDISEQALAFAIEGQITGAFAFSRGCILAFRENAIDSKGRRGVLLFTGVLHGIFATQKHALRALSQSLAKEFGKENIHVAHAVVAGGNILTDYSVSRFKIDEEFEKFKTDEDIRLRQESIAEAYLYLVNQDRSSWTWELDLRPAHGSW